MNWFQRRWRNWQGASAVQRTGRSSVEIEPDEIFLDSSNLPSLDPNQLEGRVDRPVSKLAVIATGSVFLIIMSLFGFRVYNLQVVNGAEYAAASAANRLAHSLIFAERGVLYDKNGVELAWNEPGDTLPYATRHYFDDGPGLAHLLGYVKYPRADTSGVWWRTELAGVSGVEVLYDIQLSGVNGSKIIEHNALGDIQREHLLEPPVDGTNLTLSIDAELQSKLHEFLSDHAKGNKFDGGASVIMNVKTGEILAATSFPEYQQQAMTDGDTAKIKTYTNNSASPFLFRAISGAYTPGSIVKPFVAIAALNEKIISPLKEIFSSGELSVPNPYDPDKPSIFKDWKAHGWTDMKHAIAVSSDVYFYQVGGGFDGQEGLGIERLDAYFKRFGFSAPTGVAFRDEASGIIPTPEWKEATFDGDPWRLGDTYITSIGQYGMQVTPLQAARAYAALANGGTLLTPQFILGASTEGSSVRIPDEYLKVAREGMRLAVTSDSGTARAMNVYGIEIAGKTGTAELGLHNEWMNSWAVGFWPYDNPQYAFATVLEHAPAGTNSGASPAMNPFFYWLVENRPELVK